MLCMSATGDLESNLAHVAPFVEQARSGLTSHLVGGVHVPSASGATFANTSPIDESSLGLVASGDAADVDAAARAAADVFVAWRDTPGEERRRVPRIASPT